MMWLEALLSKIEGIGREYPDIEKLDGVAFCGIAYDRLPGETPEGFIFRLSRLLAEKYPPHCGNWHPNHCKKQEENSDGL